MEFPYGKAPFRILVTAVFCGALTAFTSLNRQSEKPELVPRRLAEFVLNEAGYKGDTRKRVLDPACGSGTFLVLAIQRARESGVKNGERAIETVKRILDNIWGFDLNPLAVIAARTNYVFALGDLVRRISSIEIPVYLADSVLWPKRTGQMLLGGDGAVEVPTSVGTFQVPKIWVDDSAMMSRAAVVVVSEDF